MRLLLTGREVAARLGVTPDWLREATTLGDVPGYKIGKSWR
jgi:excisionase family DNA binding protein